MKDFLLPGYEDLEISTQLVIREAIQRKIDWKILDRPENFLQFSRNGHTEFIKEASKTRLDSYMTFLVMENKTVSKFVLKNAGIRVPEGSSFHTKEEAYQSYSEFRDLKKIIKPVTTNFGIGIEVSESGDAEGEFRRKIDRSFQHSQSIIIEEFVEGPEYRFLVLGGETVAVCNRVPANVKGDGIHSISDLVDKKNEDPRRGIGHRTPLEKIQKKETEREVLESAGWKWDSIPKIGEVVYLRKNSNISTGGDSVDWTDSVNPSFKTIAENAARSVGAAICGVDIISTGIQEQPNANNHAILEINFNPVLYIHDYPYEGKNRGVAGKVLDLLGFSI